MKWHTEYLRFHTKGRREYIRITGQVEEAVRKAGIREGFAMVSTMHTSASVFVNDADGPLLQDLDDMLEAAAPFGKSYRHHHTGEDNGDAHLKSHLSHHQVLVPVTAGKLDFGPWQQIFYGEFDGKREKRVIVKVFGE